MSRYIDADVLKEQMLKYGFHSADQTVTEFVKDTLPTADVKDVVHGEWIYGENDIGLGGYWCTACGKFVLWNYTGKIDFIHRYNYCPSCGAKMEI